jgi:tetratricopeptide (TPR) repeat protein
MASLWSNGEVETKTGDAVTIAEESLERLQQYVKFVFDRKEEKASKVQGLIDKVFAVLGSLDAEAEAALPGKQRARRAYIRGRALDAKEAFDPAAEAHLTRAVKLDPSEIEYWNGLGHVFWKKGDLEAARRSFAKGCGNGDDVDESSTAAAATATAANFSSGTASVPPPLSAVSLREMSKLLRQVPTGEGGWEDPKLATTEARLRESLARARQAVSLRVTDPESWFVLGNAYVAVFFSGPEADTSLMDKALAAYGRSEMNGGGRNPDLYFGRAQVHRYKEQYQRAADDYRRAATIDPSLPAAAALQEMDHFLNRVADLVAHRGRVRPKKLRSITDVLKAAVLPEGTPFTLVEGGAAALEAPSSAVKATNRGLALALCMVLPLGRGDFPPSSYLCVDREGTFVVLSIYHLDVSTLSDSDDLLVLDPCVFTVTYTQDVKPTTNIEGASAQEVLVVNMEKPVGKVSYRCIHVRNPTSLLVNNKALKLATATRPSVTTMLSPG